MVATLAVLDFWEEWILAISELQVTPALPTVSSQFAFNSEEEAKNRY